MFSCILIGGLCQGPQTHLPTVRLGRLDQGRKTFLWVDLQGIRLAVSADPKNPAGQPLCCGGFHGVSLELPGVGFTYKFSNLRSYGRIGRAAFGSSITL